MKLHRARSICRAQNCFSPSTVLYQHFVLPYNAAVLRQQRFASSAPASTAEDTHAPRHSFPPEPLLSSEDVDTISSSDIHRPEKLRIKYYAQHVADTPANLERLMHQYKANPNDRYLQAQVSDHYIVRKMREARIAAVEGKEYKPRVLKPKPAAHQIPEVKYPWATRSALNKPEPMAR